MEEEEEGGGEEGGEGGEEGGGEEEEDSDDSGDDDIVVTINQEKIEADNTKTIQTMQVSIAHYSEHCTVYTVQCTLYTVHCTPHSTLHLQIKQSLGHTPKAPKKGIFNVEVRRIPPPWYYYLPTAFVQYGVESAHYQQFPLFRTSTRSAV